MYNVANFIIYFLILKCIIINSSKFNYNKLYKILIIDQKLKHRYSNIFDIV
jgi:hypothetical protein